MLRREWGKISIFAALGFIVIGLALLRNQGYALSVCDITALMIFSPIYGVGLIYGLGAFFNMLGAVLKWVVCFLCTE